MALSNFVKNFGNGTIVASDGTGTPVTMTLAFDNGDLSLNNVKKILRETVAYERKGLLKTVSLGNRIYPTISFTLQMAQFTDASASVFNDFCFFQNKYVANITTLNDNDQEYAIKLQFTAEGTNFGDSADHTFTADDCVPILDSFSEGDPNTFSFSFTVYGAITGDIAAAES